MRRRRRRALICVVALLGTGFASALTAETVTVAVAANFLATARALEAEFEAASGHELRLVPGSSGRLYAQIVNGAPFDVFLSADRERPARLQAAGLVAENGRFTYAIGELLLWSRDASLDDCLAALRSPDSGRIAIAKPDVAPYGAAAREYLLAEGLWQTVTPRLVYGENVMQTLQFAATGNAALAFVGSSQLAQDGVPAASCRYRVPPDSHAPIEQQGVLLARAAGNDAAQAFVAWLSSESARSRIRAMGYRLPGDGS